MKIHETLQQLDSLLRSSQLEEAESFLKTQTEQAAASGDWETEAVLRNEQMGFYRDCGNFPESLHAAQRARFLYESHHQTNSVSYATTLLNCANAYRASGSYDAAFAAFAAVQSLYQKHLPPDDIRIAGYWNNLALLYQEVQQWENACDCLRNALNLARSKQDCVKIAISCTNLAVSLLHLSQIEEAEALLLEADTILAGRTPSDFHYSAVLAGLGDVCYQKAEFEQAATYYEAALAEIDLHMGHNNFYEIVSENLRHAYEKCHTFRPHLTGLELSSRFFQTFGLPILEHAFPEMLPELAIGLAGEGSECLGYDDAFSADHDYGPGFCIWVPAHLPEEAQQALQKAYDALPHEFYGIRRTAMPTAVQRVGICTIPSFFSRLLELPHLPETEQEWLSVPESGLAAACSGAIFRDDSRNFTQQRSLLQKGYPEPVRLRRLAQQLARMAQCGQYNYPRMRRRGDYGTAQLYLMQFCTHAMQAAHLIRRQYAPYEKWLLRSTQNLPGFSDFSAQISKLLTMAPACTTCFTESEDPVCRKIQQICNIIEQEVANMTHTSPQENAYLEQTANMLAETAESLEQHEKNVQAIVKLEWDAFDKVQNIGGRADCQDNWDTFSIMRSSQYTVWPDALLTEWLHFFETTWKDGRNLIAEKYARMMEHTDPARYATLQSQLPPLSEEFVQMREAIVQIQVSWMEAFAAEYPNLAANARIIHTEQDTLTNTSYETYLRGELSTYPPEILYAYGRWVVSLFQNQQNLAKMILEKTTKAYGYPDLEAAEHTRQL